MLPILLSKDHLEMGSLLPNSSRIVRVGGRERQYVEAIIFFYVSKSPPWISYYKSVSCSL